MQCCHPNTPKLLLLHQRKLKFLATVFSVLLSGKEKTHNGADECAGSSERPGGQLRAAAEPTD